MVAITTESHSSPAHEGIDDPWPRVAIEPSARLLPFPTPARAAAGGRPLAPEVVARMVAVVAAVVLVLAVAVGTAAFGRVLDGQRGIPSSAPEVPAATSPG